MEHDLVAGNHDLAAARKISLTDFNPYAAEANRWTAAQLSHDCSDKLGLLPLRVDQEPFTLVHGSPRDPVWEYVISTT
jgi:hypothetical protein